MTVTDVQGHADPHVTLKVYAHMFDGQRTDEAVRRALARSVLIASLRQKNRPS